MNDHDIGLLLWALVFFAVGVLCLWAVFIA